MDPAGAAVIAGVNRFVTASAYRTKESATSADDVATNGIATNGTATNGTVANSKSATDVEVQGRIFSSYYAPAGRAYALTNAERPGTVVKPGAVRVQCDGEFDIVAHAVDMVYRVLHSRDIAVFPLDIDIVSNLDDPTTGKKYGLGSSGAVSVAVIDAIARAHNTELSRLDVFKAAYVATMRAGARGSGGDIACSSHGGVVAYRRPELDTIQPLITSDPVAAVNATWPGLLVKSRPDLAGLTLLVGWTGQPVKTDDQLAAADAAARRATPEQEAVVKQFPSECAQQAEALWRALSAADTQAALEAVRKTRGLLKDFAAAKQLTIETELLAELADIAEGHGAVGKSSGSGGGDCGIALAPQSVDTDKLVADWVAAGVEPLDVRLAPMAAQCR